MAKATEAAKERAEESGVDLSKVEGTGKDGSVTAGDVEKAAEEQADPNNTAANERAAELAGFVPVAFPEGTTAVITEDGSVFRAGKPVPEDRLEELQGFGVLPIKEDS